MQKRRLTWLIVASMLLVTTGCGKYAEDPKTKPPAAAENPSGSSGGGSSTGSPGTGTSTGSNTGSSTANPSGSTGTQTGKPATPTYEKVKLGPLQKGEAAKIGPLTITLEQVDVITTAAGIPQGYAHLLAKVTVANTGNEGYTINVTDHLKMETPEAKRAPYNISATANRSPRLQGTVLKGEPVTGWLGYLAKVVPGNYRYTFVHPDWGEATWEFPL